ncbi:unnamed protein product, partial [Ceratitis capitata]
MNAVSISYCLYKVYCVASRKFSNLRITAATAAASAVAITAMIMSTSHVDHKISLR